MFLTDYHTHSLCSPDSSAPLTAMAQAAREARHGRALSHRSLRPSLRRGQAGPVLPVGPHRETAVPDPACFCGILPIKMGLELGEAWEVPAAAAKLVSRPGLDFVIGSVHNRGRAAGGIDFYYVNYNSEETCYAALDDYFSCMEALAELDCYDVLGHVIYPLRYMNGRDGNHVTLDRYWDRIREIFRRVIATGQGH